MIMDSYDKMTVDRKLPIIREAALIGIGALLVIGGANAYSYSHSMDDLRQKFYSRIQENENPKEAITSHNLQTERALKNLDFGTRLGYYVFWFSGEQVAIYRFKKTYSM